jgi:hypothetical protein
MNPLIPPLTILALILLLAIVHHVLQETCHHESLVEIVPVWMVE